MAVKKFSRIAFVLTLTFSAGPASSGIFPSGFGSAFVPENQTLIRSSVMVVVAAGCITTFAAWLNRSGWFSARSPAPAPQEEKEQSRTESAKRDMPSEHYLDEINRMTSDGESSISQEGPVEGKQAELKKNDLSSLEKAFENYLFIRTVSAQQ